MKLEYIILIIICNLITPVVLALIMKKEIAHIIKYMSCVSYGIIEYYKSNDEEEKEAARNVVATSLALDFGINTFAREWLRDTCNENISCDECIYWTCATKEKNNEKEL